MRQRKRGSSPSPQDDGTSDPKATINKFRHVAKLLNPGVKALCHLRVDQRPEGLQTNNMAAWERDALLLFCIQHLPPCEGENDEGEIE